MSEDYFIEVLEEARKLVAARKLETLDEDIDLLNERVDDLRSGLLLVTFGVILYVVVGRIKHALSYSE